ncbi:PAS domain S-box protein [Desulfobulbus alkaliphilus]|uniref:PAS domain S-box protein n=1 Tax=Desulfobulbus alkaliphilus TaxID=869814 RepID=UPI0019643671|nr:PAS domain S-box protein [Desulfobulbus alkaliphilus]MBM9536349.1 PAS domain S-box protein [Desulfobulbus alkaliphilus]
MPFNQSLRTLFSSRTKGRSLALVALLVIITALFSWQTVIRVDADLRAELLTQARLAAQEIAPDQVLALSASAADLTTGPYQELKKQLAAMRRADDQFTFVYLMARSDDGSLVILVDSEPVASRGYSPPGDSYEEAPAAYHKVFATGEATVAGPVSDRWGTWVSALVPLVDPVTEKPIAVLGLDINAQTWKMDVVAGAILPIGLLLTGLIAITTALAAFRPIDVSPRPVLRRLMLPLAAMLLLLTAGFFVLLTIQHTLRLENLARQTVQDVEQDLHLLLEAQSKKLAALQEILILDTGMQAALADRNRQALLQAHAPLFAQLKSNHAITHLYFMDTERICLLRVHNPDKYGDRFDRFTALAAEQNHGTSAGIELGPLGTFTLRVVRPVFADDTLIGYLELGKEIEDILVRIHQHLGVHLALTLNKGAITRQTWENGMHMLGREADWDRFPEDVLIFSSLTPLPAAMEHFVSQPANGTGERTHFANRFWTIMQTPLRDAAGIEVGDLVILRDITTLDKMQTRVLVLAAGFALILVSGLLGLFTVLLRRSDTATQTQQAKLLEHQELLAATLRSIGDGVITCDARGNVVGLNTVAEHLTGWSTEEAQGRPIGEIFTIIHAQTRKPAVNPVDTVLREDRTVSLANHTMLIARDGTEYQIADSCAPIHSTENTVQGAVLVFRDVTEEYYRRERLRESEEMHRQLFEQSPDACLLWEDGIFTDCNAAALTLLRATREEVIGHSVERFSPQFQPDGTPSVVSAADHSREALEKGAARFEWLHRTLDGDDIWGKISLAAMTAGNTQVLLATIRDITERKQAERMTAIRLDLIEFATNHNLAELLTRSLDLIGEMVHSPIGFYHFVEPDQQTLSLQQWSTATLERFCAAAPGAVHYNIDQAGVWVDCVRQRQPVIHNDYRSLANKKGLPEGHAEVIREMVVPVLREERIVAILGVGNKGTEYTESDLKAVTFIADVTLEIVERKRAEEQLRNEKNLMTAITDSAQDAIVMLSPGGTISFWNPAAERIFGYTHQEAMGRDLHDLLAPQRYLPLYQKNLPLFQQSGQGAAVGKTVELDALCKDGGEIPVELSLSAVLLPDGWHAVGIMRDITERKQVEKTMRENNQALQHQTRRAEEMAARAEMASIAKSEFLANMSHEIRTPMNGVIGMTGLLLDTELDDDQRHYAEIVRTSGELLLNLINDILDFSKIEAGKLDLETMDFDLAGLLEDFADTMAVRAHEKGLELLYSIDPEVPTQLRGDPGRLRQMLTNLTGNAVKFTATGEVAVLVSMDHESETTALLRFAVRDTGIGIAADKLDLLFDKFSQVDASTTRQYGGTGLGLAICRQLSELMGGDIGVTSQPGQGSEFWFTALFVKQAEVAANPPVMPGDLHGVRVLIVDDNATNRELLTVRLKSWGMRPAEAADGSTALTALYRAVDDADPFLLAVIDMQMPNMDGETLGRSIRADSRLRATRLIMLTSLGARGDARRFAEIGFSAYLTKPVRLEELQGALSLALTAGDTSQTTPRAITTRHTVREALGHFHTSEARILLAEDNPTNQQVALGILKKLGLKADAVANGKEAVKAVRTIPYDLVLMDVQMPVMDGLEATRQIRRYQSALDTTPVPIIAMTAHAMRGDRERCLQAGMNDYLTKPVVPTTLIETLQQWLPREKATHDGHGTAQVAMNTETTVQGAETLVWDKKGMVARLMDDEQLARTIVAGFLEDLPRQLAALVTAVAAGDGPEIKRLAHTIKGSAANVGCDGLREAAAALEITATDLVAAQQGLPRLRAAFDQLKEAMEVFCAPP